jgi:hypothetical protein
MQLGRGRKDPKSVSGAPFPPAVEHSDGPDHPRRDVPTADEAGEAEAGEAEAESEQEEDDT